MATALLAALLSSSGSPANPVEQVVYGLRPANLSATLENRNTGDAAGDLLRAVPHRRRRYGLRLEERAALLWLWLGRRP